jgi:putative hydrolase of the HAD superfamily
VAEVYARAFLRWGVEASQDSVDDAVQATWREVADRRARGEERWGARDGERGFWRRFVQGVFGRVGGSELPEALLDELIEHFGNPDHWSVYPDVVPVLDELSRRGTLLAVVSNWDSSLPRLLERLELAPRFSAIVVSALAGVSKPSARIFEEALARTGVAADEVLHVGDHPAEDYEGAQAAGLSALLLDRMGHRHAAAESISSLAEIPAWLDKEGS